MRLGALWDGDGTENNTQAPMTDLVRIHVMLSSEELADIVRFREREGMRSKKEAVSELIRLGLRVANETKRAERDSEGM